MWFTTQSKHHVLVQVVAVVEVGETEGTRNPVQAFCAFVEQLAAQLCECALNDAANLKRLHYDVECTDQTLSRQSMPTKPTSRLGVVYELSPDCLRDQQAGGN